MCISPNGICDAIEPGVARVAVTIIRSRDHGSRIYTPRTLPVSFHKGGLAAVKKKISTTASKAKRQTETGSHHMAQKGIHVRRPMRNANK
jgi:hypothetical protein